MHEHTTAPVRTTLSAARRPTWGMRITPACRRRHPPLGPPSPASGSETVLASAGRGITTLACAAYWYLPVGAAPRLQDSFVLRRSADVDPGCFGMADRTSSNTRITGSPTRWVLHRNRPLWLPGPRRWMLTLHAGSSAVEARCSTRCWGRLCAIRRADHRPRQCGRYTDSTPLTALGPLIGALLADPASYPYGPYPLEAYTSWDPRTGILDLYYLLSLLNPYQVQVMRTQIRVP
jgi:hypothetical protein